MRAATTRVLFGARARRRIAARGPPRQLGARDRVGIEFRAGPVARDGVAGLEIGQHAIVVAGGVAEGRGRARQVERGAHRRLPRVVVLLAQHDDEQAEEAEFFFGVVGLPHADLELGQAIGIERAQRARPRRRAHGNRPNRSRPTAPSRSRSGRRAPARRHATRARAACGRAASGSSAAASRRGSSTRATCRRRRSPRPARRSASSRALAEDRAPVRIERAVDDASCSADFLGGRLERGAQLVEAALGFVLGRFHRRCGVRQRIVRAPSALASASFCSDLSSICWYESPSRGACSWRSSVLDALEPLLVVLDGGELRSSSCRIIAVRHTDDFLARRMSP